LREIAAQTGMELVNVRPALVYGPGVKANFHSMMQWLAWGVPLPFGSIHNRRSLVAIDNLVDLLITCLRHPRAANETFVVSDGQDLSTTELLQRMAAALGRQARLIPVPPTLLEKGSTLLQGHLRLEPLLCSLQVDMRKTTERLGWVPPVSVDAGLASTAAHFLRGQHR
jgi:UDP-4-keto-D-QuiNAc 4-reductase